MDIIKKDGRAIAVYFDGSCWIAGQAVDGQLIKGLARERSRQMAIDCALARYDAMCVGGSNAAH